MKIKSYIDEGNLEQYCFEPDNSTLAGEIGRLQKLHPEAGQELVEIEIALEHLANTLAVAPGPKLKNSVMAALGFPEEIIDINNLPPTSSYSDYQKWLNAVEHLIPAEPFDDFFAHVLQQNEQMAQTLVITKLDVPEEVHEVVAESFFILKGTCICTVGKEVFTLNAGDHLAIPLHTSHDIHIVSPYVIAILQHQFA
ncbi:MAG: cupin domain-containing protein [Sphingobacteriaceae bacterium]|nr:MAG: cupin domain-containing protein [Sphingobacteriaceae bacterium]